MTAVGSECARCRSPYEVGDLLCAVCGEVAPRTEERAIETVQVEVLRCRDCGAATRWDARERGVSCAFCGSVVAREQLVDPPEQTEAYLPFLVPRAAAERALEAWLGTGGFFRPGDLSKAARLESLHPLHWVAWAFDATARVSWTADSNAGSRRSDWAPHSGQTEMTFDDVLVSASRGLDADEAAALAWSYDLGTAAPELEEAAGDATVEAFDVQRSLARSLLLAAIEEHAAARVEAECVPGSRFRKVRVALLLRGLETRRLALPAWVLAYRYRDELYRVVISGQDADAIEGRMPISPWRILAVILVVAAVVAVILAVAAS